MHKSWCNQVSSEKSQNKITFNKSSGDETACAAVAKAVIEDLITAVEQKENNTVNKVKEERSSYTFEFKLKVLKDLNHGQLAACDVEDKHGIHKSLLTKWKKEEKRIINYVAEGTKKRLLKKERTSTKHRAMFVKLYQRFVKARILCFICTVSH